MKEALEKWQRLFCIKILCYNLSSMGVFMLVYVPNKRLSEEEATQRNADFDTWWLEHSRTKRKPREHNFSSEMLCDISKFMQLFKPDLRFLHRTLPRPKDLLPGCARFPVYRRRFSSTVVQHDALPPVFTLEQFQSIQKQLKELEFEKDENTHRKEKLHMSQHGIGTLPFLAEVEEQCYIQLKARNREPKLWKVYYKKYIAPLTQEALNSRLGELILREDYEDYPKTWSLLMTLDMQTDILLDPDKISMDLPMPALRRVGLVGMCLPFSLALLLTDGLLRWYYKSTKDVEFPHYNYYRRLRDYERPKGARY